MILKLVLGDGPTMSLFRTIAIVVLSISAFVFVALFGRLPVFRKTPIGFLYRVLMIHAPNAFMRVDEQLTGRRVTRSFTRSINYLLNEPHPLVMIFFILLQLISEILFIPPAIPHIPIFPHYYLIALFVTMPYYTLYLCYTTKSTIRTAADHASALRAYPYDYILYHPNQPCRTCRVSKPARSKHCSLCRGCVQRQDHHCVWINNCVGRNNHGHFVALLLSMAALLAYATYLGYTILDAALQTRYVPARLTRGSTTSKRWSTRLNWSEYVDAWSWAIAMNTRIGAVTLLALLTFPLAFAFLAYHAYILWAGVTTNESSKWSYLREDVADGLVWKARIDDMHAEYAEHMGGRQKTGDQGFDRDRDDPGRRTWKGPWAEWWVIRTRQGLQPVRTVRVGTSGQGSVRDRDGDRADHTHQSSISFAGKDGVMLNTSDHKLGGPNRGHHDGENDGRVQTTREEFDDRWQRVRSLHTDIDNIYDLGFWRNFKDNLFNRG